MSKHCSILFYYIRTKDIFCFCVSILNILKKKDFSVIDLTLDEN